jgi:glyoxylase-like metal-dependent hydrolase (beta-lactamase superfamily II)
MKIIDHLFVVPNVVANPYLILDENGITVIDTGLPRGEKKILAYITSLGRRAQDIKRIIITHADLDHFGGLAALQAASGARAFASKIEAHAIAAGKSSREIKPAGFSLRRMLFALVSPFVKAAPFQSAGVLSCGDSMVSDQNTLQGSRPGITWDESKARESERKQAALGAQIVCSGHGPVVMDAVGKFPV